MHSGSEIMNRNETFSIAFRVQFYKNPSREGIQRKGKRKVEPRNSNCQHGSLSWKTARKELGKKERSRHSIFMRAFSMKSAQLEPIFTTLRYILLSDVRPFCDDEEFGPDRSPFQIELGIMQGSFSSDLLKGIFELTTVKRNFYDGKGASKWRGKESRMSSLVQVLTMLQDNTFWKVWLCVCSTQLYGFVSGCISWWYTLADKLNWWYACLAKWAELFRIFRGFEALKSRRTSNSFLGWAGSRRCFVLRSQNHSKIRVV